MLWLLVKLAFVFYVHVMVMVEHGQSSYSGGASDHHKYYLRLRNQIIQSSSPSHRHRYFIRPTPRLYHVTDFGADPTGVSDSTQALELALSHAYANNNNNNYQHLLMQGVPVPDLGGSPLHLDGGTYLIRRPLRFPNSGAANFMVWYEDPVQLLVAGSFFLGNAFVFIKSLQGIACGVNIVDNMFSGDYTGVPIVQLDQTFTDIHQVVVDRNSVRGMMVKSTVAKGTLWSNGTSWTLDFSRVLLFPNLINHVKYTLHLHHDRDQTAFPNHILRNISGNRVTVESDKPIPATLHVMVDQINA
ncbi:hypothetical protein L6164_004657 [Bauhinia variegata]|uniref:Uncharacterized protein n=1 Tax=Bauhinia variegata TaxID=167791 RepID=A0ACB9Q548_BAUVA|nr:hypothetical protein L6164_004657 [Bauhinia variegata]